MSKIDKESLVKEIERLKDGYNQASSGLMSESLASMMKVEALNKVETLNKVLAIISSMPDEPSKSKNIDLVAELRKYLATTPKEQLNKDWESLKEWDNVGPTVDEFLYGIKDEPSSEDLEKEIDVCWQNWLSPSNQKEVEGVLPKTEFSMYARHFYELGKNSK